MTEDNKSRVAAIHDLKEKLKSENDELKKIKHKLKEVQEKQKAEKEVSLTDCSMIKKHFYYRVNSRERDTRGELAHRL